MSDRLPLQADAVPTRAAAERVARETLARADPGTEWVILDDAVRERAFGWVFFYTTAGHARTRDIRDAKPGNGPLVVERGSGATHFLSSALPPHLAIAAFEAAWDSARGAPR